MCGGHSLTRILYVLDSEVEGFFRFWSGVTSNTLSALSTEIIN